MGAITKYEVAIVGGGPAGLACAIESARRGLATVVLERRALPCDKACGEGVMPAGVRALEALGVRALLSPADATPLKGIRYVQEDGSTAEGCLPDGGGLGVRRVALAGALLQRAREVGAEVRERVEVMSHWRTGRSVLLMTTSGAIVASVLVAADGLASPLREVEGLDVAAHGPRRFGLRRHFRVAPWAPFVEVHFAADAEAYVTPVGEQRVGVAFLWDTNRVAGPVSLDALLSRFPMLARRLQGAVADSSVRGAGPLERLAHAQVADRFVLLGDAAGYVDAITGEGLSLAFTSAATLGELLPAAVAHGATTRALAPYQRAYRNAFRRYARLARALLHLAARPALRRRVIRFLGRHPQLFDRVLQVTSG